MYFTSTYEEFKRISTERPNMGSIVAFSRWDRYDWFHALLHEDPVYNLPNKKRIIYLFDVPQHLRMQVHLARFRGLIIFSFESSQVHESLWSVDSYHPVPGLYLVPPETEALVCSGFVQLERQLNSLVLKSGYGDPRYTDRDDIRILLVTSKYTSMAQYQIGYLSDNLAAVGATTRVLIEGSGQVLQAHQLASAIDTFKPHAVLTIDHLRSEWNAQVKIIPDETVFISWVMDELPIFKDASAVGQLGDNDLTYFVSDALLRSHSHMDYPQVGVLPFQWGVHAYDETPYEPRVCCVTHLLPLPPEASVYWEELNTTGAATCRDPKDAKEQRLYSLTLRTWHRLRQVITLAGAGIQVHCYGKGWENYISDTEYITLCGEKPPGDPPLEEYAASLHYDPAHHMHPRVLEALAGYTPTVSYVRNPGVDPEENAIVPYHTESELIFEVEQLIASRDYREERVVKARRWIKENRPPLGPVHALLETVGKLAVTQ